MTLQTLSPEEVAQREDVPVHRIWRLIRQGRLFPVKREGRSYRIGLPYTFGIIGNGMLGPKDLKQAARAPGAGRPPGSKNRRPYPAGVKRPRRSKE